MIDGIFISKSSRKAYLTTSKPHKTDENHKLIADQIK